LADPARAEERENMGIFDFITQGVRELAIARPDDKKDLIVFKHPDSTIPNYAQLTIDADEAAVFLRDGGLVGVLRSPGAGQRHSLTSENIPFLDRLVDKATGGQLFQAELHFVTMRPIYDQPFGGELGLIEDPLLGEMISPRIFGTFSFQIIDPAAFLLKYVGLGSGGSNDDVLRWIKGLLLNSIRTVMGQVLVEQQTSMLQLMAMQQTLALRFAQNAPELGEIGCRIITVGQFQVNISEADKATLSAAQAEIGAAKRAARVANIGIAQAAAEAQQRQYELDQRFNQDARYVKELTGDFSTYAGGQALLGAGQGMAGGGESAVGAAAQLGVGFALASQLARGVGGSAPPPPAAGLDSAPAARAQVSCPGCKQVVSPGRYCCECGTALTSAPRACSSCGTPGVPSSRFCAQCGTAFPEPA
jgi:membrane protease subunit (stomatin/prohibitin family)